MVTNRGIVYAGPEKVEIQSIDFPKLALGDRRCDHGVILKVVTTSICSSDQYMVRGGTTVPHGLILGHEITGEVIEAGRDVQFIKIGDPCSVPFNIACGRCRNCREGKTNVCLNVNASASGAAYGYVGLGGWVGGQAEYVMVPYADFNLLKFPDKAQAMEKIIDLACLPDILPTAYHGVVTAGVKPGSTVYIAGAGTLGLAAAAAAQLLGAAVVIVGDLIPERLAQAKSFGCEVVDVSKEATVADQIAQIVGEPLVDCGVDSVGFEARGHRHGGVTKEASATVLNSLMAITRAGGSIGIPGLYVTDAPDGMDETAKTGNLSIRIGLGWAKSHYFFTGQCPVMRYNRQLMMAIFHDKIQIARALNVKVIGFDEGPTGYKDFDRGISTKFVIDPHQLFFPRVAYEDQSYRATAAQIVLNSAASMGANILKELRASRDTDSDTTLSRLAKALGPRAWMVDSLAAPVYVVEGVFYSTSLEAIAEVAISEILEIDITAVSSYDGASSQSLLMGLYPSGAVRTIAGTMRRIGSRYFFRLEDVLDLIDPDSPDDWIPLAEPLRFCVHIVPLKDSLV